MAVVVTSISQSPGLAAYVYNITGLVNGANAITLPTPPANGSFPPDGTWTPTVIQCQPHQTGAIANTVTPDLSTITQTAGAVTFTLYAAGATNCQVTVY